METLLDSLPAGAREALSETLGPLGTEIPELTEEDFKEVSVSFHRWIEIQLTRTLAQRREFLDKARASIAEIGAAPLSIRRSLGLVMAEATLIENQISYHRRQLSYLGASK